LIYEQVENGQYSRFVEVGVVREAIRLAQEIHRRLVKAGLNPHHEQKFPEDP
jgi:hypothetical protein